jgi:hypothetical protein
MPAAAAQMTAGGKSMKRLSHPIRRVREPFGTAGLIVACIALIAALGGTALAAAKLNSTQKKEVEKIAKKSAKAGPAGANGTAGAQGPAGKDGAAGKEGAAGKSGTNGTNGTTGFTKTLPSGETETGVWVAQQESEEFNSQVSVSFPIPLSAGFDASHVFFIGKNKEGTEHETECPGSVESPAAAKGFFCVYTGREAGLTPVEIVQPFGVTNGTGTSGAILQLAPANAEASTASGTWAVRAP